MTTMLIVYTTSLGNTQQMAEAIADGARSVAETNVYSLPRLPSNQLVPTKGN